MTAPDAHTATEPLLVLRMHLVLARDIAQRMSLADVPATVQAEMVEAFDAINSVLHDNAEPAIAMAQRHADETEGELEAATVEREFRALRHSVGLEYGRPR